MHRDTFIAKLTRIAALRQQLPGDSSHQSAADRRTTAGRAASQRARQVRCSPLPVAQGIPVSLPTRRKRRQANRALCRLDFPSRREHGLQGRISPMGGFAADWKLITVGYRDRSFKKTGNDAAPNTWPINSLSPCMEFQTQTNHQRRRP